MKTRIAILLAAMCILAMMPGTTANAQETGADKTRTPKPAWNFYRLDFNVREMDNGKTLNSRSYTMNTRSGGGGGEWNQIRVGTRIPYVGEKGPTYMDVGFNVDCHMEAGTYEGGIYHEGEALTIRTDLSSLPTGEQTQEKGVMPLIRSLKTNSVIPVVLNKPILVASVDEVGSTHRMQVEVTITQLK